MLILRTAKHLWRSADLAACVSISPTVKELHAADQRRCQKVNCGANGGGDQWGIAGRALAA
ncbi:hypothetical protein HaLaN_29700, partial [Haematococcus lacustris]